MSLLLRHPNSGLYWTEDEIDRYRYLEDEPMSRVEAIRELVRDGFKVIRPKEFAKPRRTLAVALIEGIGRLVENVQKTTTHRVDSPYYTKEEAADYLRTTVSGIYARVERRQLERCPGVHEYLFTKEMLNDSAMGRVRKPLTFQVRKRRQTK